MTKVIDSLREKYKEQVEIASGVLIPEDALIALSPGAKLKIDEGISIGRGFRLELLKNSHVKIGRNVKIGDNTFISIMSQLYIGDSVGIANMVDIHDHNHKVRSIESEAGTDSDINASGFDVAPIVIENAAAISSGVSILAGVRIGQNSIIGARSVASRSIPPNVVAKGSPAKASRTFLGRMQAFQPRQRISVAFFGTSLTQHLEAYAPAVYQQLSLPEIGSSIKVEEWRKRGYASQLENAIKTKWPHIDFAFHNFGVGGANTRRVLKEVERRLDAERGSYDLCFLEVGLNDVWRQFQNRPDEAVGLEEYASNHQKILGKLMSRSRQLVCMSETPFGFDDSKEQNEVLQKYNDVAQSNSSRVSVPFIDLYTPFIRASECFKSNGNTSSLWSDGVHMTETGDTLIAQTVFDEVLEGKLIQKLFTLTPVDRARVFDVYPPADTSLGFKLS